MDSIRNASLRGPAGNNQQALPRQGIRSSCARVIKHIPALAAESSCLLTLACGVHIISYAMGVIGSKLVSNEFIQQSDLYKKTTQAIDFDTATHLVLRFFVCLMLEAIFIEVKKIHQTIPANALIQLERGSVAFQAKRMEIQRHTDVIAEELGITHKPVVLIRRNIQPIFVTGTTTLPNCAVVKIHDQLFDSYDPRNTIDNILSGRIERENYSAARTMAQNNFLLSEEKKAPLDFLGLSCPPGVDQGSFYKKTLLMRIRDLPNDPIEIATRLDNYEIKDKLALCSLLQGMGSNVICAEEFHQYLMRSTALLAHGYNENARLIRNSVYLAPLLIGVISSNTWLRLSIEFQLAHILFKKKFQMNFPLAHNRTANLHAVKVFEKLSEESQKKIGPGLLLFAKRQFLIDLLFSDFSLETIKKDFFLKKAKKMLAAWDFFSTRMNSARALEYVSKKNIEII